MTACMLEALYYYAMTQTMTTGTAIVSEYNLGGIAVGPYYFTKATEGFVLDHLCFYHPQDFKTCTSKCQMEFFRMIEIQHKSSRGGDINPKQPFDPPVKRWSCLS